MAKYHLLMTKPGSARVEAKAVMRGEYRDGADSGEILVMAGMTPEELKAIAGGSARVLLDWYVAEGVLPAAQ